METYYNQDGIVQASAGYNLKALQNRNRKIKRDSKVKIDISKTEYPLLRTVAVGELGWRVWTREESKQEVSLFWVDTYVNDQLIRKMKTYQRINHFPGSQQLGKKNFLTDNLNRMKKIHQSQYQFYPQTFNIPAETEEYERFVRNNSQVYFIVKPYGDSQGRGIYIAKSIDLALKEEVVVQEYIQNPLLIEQMKFDLRIYVLLKSVTPLKIYIYEEGLSRLATCQYQKPQPNNLKNMRMHLTNYAINKFSPTFIFNKSQEEDNIGHKRSYTATMKTLQGLGCDIQKLQSDIDKIIVKTLIAAHNNLTKRYKQLRDSKQQHESVCFQILGFDILVKDNFQPILLQVNHSPSFCTQTPLDTIIKKCLILDTLNLLNLNHQDRINHLKGRDQQFISNSVVSHYPKFNGKLSNKDVQDQQLGAYRRIYPLDNLPDNEQAIKLYDKLIRNVKPDKAHRVYAKCSLPAATKNQRDNSMNDIDNILFQNRNQGQNNNSFSLYQVINNLKLKRIRNYKDMTEVNMPTFQELVRNSQFDTDLETELIHKEELMICERRMRKEKEKEKKKYVLPMPLNSVSIKLDDKYTHVRRQKKSNYHYYPDTSQNPFKIHSFLNAQATQLHSQRKKARDIGNQTACNQYRQASNNEVTFRSTDRTGNFYNPTNPYSFELRHKIQKMQMARLKLQKSKKIDRANFIIIKSKSVEKGSGAYDINME